MILIYAASYPFVPPLISGVIAMSALAACRAPAKPDAYGNVEATEVVVASQASGQLEAFAPIEGAAHSFPIETPLDFTQRVREFLA